MKLTHKAKRLVYVLLAITLGSGIVLALSMAGEKSKGPIENLLDHTSEAVQDIEKQVILDQREDKRSDKLKWFEAYQQNINKLKRPETIFLGASDDHKKDSYETIINLEDSLKTTFPLIHIYAAWGKQTG